MKMLKNNNQKFIRTLSNSSLKANKRRNYIAILAIILTAVLFMSLTTVFEGVQITVKEQRFRQVGSKFMVSVKGLTEEEAKTLVSDSAFSEVGIERPAANVINPELKNLSAVMEWMDSTAMKNQFIDLEDGYYPENEDEIACDSEVLRLFGLPYKVGSKIRLQYTAGEKVLEKEVTVCGIWKGMKYEKRAAVLISEAFAEEILEQYDGKYAQMKETSYDVRGSYQDEKQIAKTLDGQIRALGYDPDAQQGEDGFVTHHVNPVYETDSETSYDTYVIAGIGVLLILLAGYLIIYNIFKISIEKDIRLYGQLKTVGTSPKQIQYMIVRQGMILSAAGIPVGLVLGWLLGNLLLPLVMKGSSYQETTFIVPSVLVWILSAAFTLVTVRISCSKPGRIAGRISPVEALKYQGMWKMKKACKKGGNSKHRLLSMAIGNLSRNKGRTVLVVLSVALSSVILNSVLNYTGSMSEETYVKQMSFTDFDVTDGTYGNLSAENYTKVVDKELAEELERLEEVTDFARIYCNLLPSEGNPEDNADLGIVTRLNGKETPKGETVEEVDKFDRRRMLYGYDETACAMSKVIEGSLDYEKLLTGEYVVAAGYLDDYGEYIYDAQQFHAGDVIEAEINGNVKEYTVMAVIGAKMPQLMNYSRGGYEALVFAEPVFLEMFPRMQNPIHCLFNAKDGTFDALNEAVAEIAARGDLSVQTRLTAEEEFREMERTYSMVGIIVSLILGGIGILNLVNVIMTGAISRKKEFASMRSIGMTKKQLQKLMIYEGLCYAVLAGFVGLLFGGLISATLVRMLAESTWYMDYRFTVLPSVSAAAVCLVLAVAISALTDRVWNKGSIVEQLRDCE